MGITLDQLGDICPNADDDVLNGFLETMDESFEAYELTTPLRQAHFLAQAAHESGGFTIFTENLNYSAQGLLKIFHKYFPNESLAESYARQPRKIASRVYANRMGNGDEASGDGYKYRGRGVFQVTGKANYELMANELNIDCVNNPDLLLSTDNALESALVFWDKHNLNPLADRDDVEGITRKINGGTNGLDDRISYLRRAKRALGA